MADFLFLTLKSWFYSCTHPTNIADVNFHSLLALAPTPQKQKKPILLFSLVKNFISDLWFIRCLFLTYEKLSNLSEFVQFITNNFFSNLACSISQYVHDKPP